MQVSNQRSDSSVKQILLFLLWSFGIAWSAWIVSVLLKDRVPLLPQLLYILGAFGPAIGTKVVLGKSLKEMIAFIKVAKKGSWPYLLLYTGLFTTVMLIWSKPLPNFNFVRIFIIFLITTILTGGNEEIGWQGFLQPTLEKILPFPLATVISGLIWALWHLPLFFMPGSSQVGVTFIAFVLFCPLGRFWLAALYKKTQSVLYCMLFHGLINTIGEVIFIGKGTENPRFFIGYSLIALYSIYLWYQSQRQEEA